MLLATKLKNQIAKIDPSLQTVKLKNISVNGAKRGCSGFVVNPGNGRVVYVNTEESCYGPLKGQTMMRYANDTSDYGGRGGRNEWVAVERTAEAICKMLTSPALTHLPLEPRTAR